MVQDGKELKVDWCPQGCPALAVGATRARTTGAGDGNGPQ